MLIRPATLDDIPFLIDAIICAEKSGTATIGYCRIFNISEQDFRVLLRDILSEDIGGQELCVSGFLVAESDGQTTATACGWVEADMGSPSSIVKANLLYHFLGPERIAHAGKYSEMLARLSFQRQPGTLQLESVYVRGDFRGKGLIQQVLGTFVDRAQTNGILKAQIVVAGNNQSALRAYRKLGFEISEVKCISPAEVAGVLPSDSKMLLEKSLS